MSLAFASSEPGSTFTCAVDGEPGRPCTSPASFKLGKGRHTIAVAATDKAGNTDPTPATVQVRVKRKHSS